MVAPVSAIVDDGGLERGIGCLRLMRESEVLLISISGVVCPGRQLTRWWSVWDPPIGFDLVAAGWWLSARFLQVALVWETWTS